MKKIYLYAYDKQNLGDDLFIHTICTRYPEVKFYIWSDRKNRQTFSCLPNLRVIDKDSWLVRGLDRVRPSLVARYKYWYEKRCDAVVYIGGSIFIEYPAWESFCTWWEFEAENRPFYVLGANFGPWHTDAYRKKMSQIFEKMKDVCFRDQYSYDLFRDVATVRQAPDILFSYPMPKVPVKGKQVFVSVIDCAGRDESHGLSVYDTDYVRNISTLLQDYLDKGYTLILSSFCKEEGDEVGIQKILSAMDHENDPRIKILAYDGTNAAALTAAIAESELVVATRFHAAILAMAADRPVLPIVYSDKTLHVLEDLDFDGPVLDLRDDVQWNKNLTPTTMALDNMKKLAQNHFKMLDESVGGAIDE